MPFTLTAVVPVRWLLFSAPQRRRWSSYFLGEPDRSHRHNATAVFSCPPPRVRGAPPDAIVGPPGPHTLQSCLLLLREPGESGTIECLDGRSIALYSVVPLYVEERDLELAVGVEGLLQRFQEFNITPVIDPSRPNVGKGLPPE